MVGSGLVPACGAKEENITLNQAVFVSQDMSFNYSDLSSETIGIMTDWSNDWFQKKRKDSWSTSCVWFVSRTLTTHYLNDFLKVRGSQIHQHLLLFWRSQIKYSEASCGLLWSTHFRCEPLHGLLCRWYMTSLGPSCSLLTQPLRERYSLLQLDFI